MSNIIPKNTTIETGDTNVLAVCYCENQEPNDKLVGHGESPVLGDINGDYTLGSPELVYVRRDGEVTNNYATGGFGVTEGDREAAKCDDELFCEECESYIRGWLHLSD